MFQINIENIEAFVYVIHCGSFNKAADALYLSQPSVTARIKSLEQELDCKLFDRQGKQIQITEDRQTVPAVCATAAAHLPEGQAAHQSEEAASE